MRLLTVYLILLLRCSSVICSLILLTSQVVLLLRCLLLMLLLLEVLLLLMFKTLMLVLLLIRLLDEFWLIKRCPTTMISSMLTILMIRKSIRKYYLLTWLSIHVLLIHYRWRWWWLLLLVLIWSSTSTKWSSIMFVLWSVAHSVICLRSHLWSLLILGWSTASCLVIVSIYKLMLWIIIWLVVE